MTSRFPVRLDPDAIVIGRDRGRPAGAALLSVPGGVLWVDPLDPSDPVLELTEPERAEETVVALFGLGAWQSIRTMPTHSVDRTDVGSGWALADASRLALLRWLAEYSPDPLDTILLEMESVVLAAKLSPLSGEPEVSPDVRRRALDLAWETSRHEQHGIPELSDLVTDVLAILAETGDEQARSALEAVRAVIKAGPSSGRQWDLRSVLTPMPAGRVLDGDVEPGVTAWHTCATDWDLVPRGAFDPEEDAIRWRIHRADDGTSRVEVAAAAGWDPRGQYLARLQCEGSEMPLALISLTLAGEQWAGSSALFGPAEDPARCWVDITSAEHPRPARRGTARTAAQARRWAVRAVTRLRFGVAQGALLVASSPMDDAVGSLERARMAYAAIGGYTGELSHRRRHFELGVLLLAALQHRGEHHEVDDLAQELAVEAAALALDADSPGRRGIEVASVDLHHPAWRLSVAELGLLVPTL